jgi:hypothetical protein
MMRIVFRRGRPSRPLTRPDQAVKSYFEAFAITAKASPVLRYAALAAFSQDQQVKSIDNGNRVYVSDGRLFERRLTPLKLFLRVFLQ